MNINVTLPIPQEQIADKVKELINEKTCLTNEIERIQNEMSQTIKPLVEKRDLTDHLLKIVQRFCLHTIVNQHRCTVCDKYHVDRY